MDDDSAERPDSRSWWVGSSVAVTVVALVVALIAVAGGGDDHRSTDEIAGPTTSGPAPTVASTSASTSTVPSRTTTTRPSTTTVDTTDRGVPATTIDLDDTYELVVDDAHPGLSNRDLPDEPDADEPPPSTLAPPPWAASTRITEGGHVSADVGCTDDGSLAALDRFFGGRVGPVLGWDYQHVYALGGDRYLWLFQDAFVDHRGTATALSQARFVHNAALVQDGDCFRLLHRGTATRPAPFEVGDGGSETRVRWWWPMGGELHDGRLWVFWAEMVKDPYDPLPPDGLGWHPTRTWLASYDPATLERRSFDPSPNPSATPVYGYAVASDAGHTYLFGNTFEQNLVREGGFWSPDHSATAMWLARVPRGRLGDAPEYRTADGWSPDPAQAVPIVDRFHVENPMQPRFLDGQWVSATAVDGYWGDHLAIDVAEQPWGPWYTVAYDPLVPRGADPKMNTYHAHLLPWRDGFGSIQISVSNNARDMRRDAWFSPHRYRPTFRFHPYQPTPTTTTTPPTTTTTSPTTTSTTTSTTTTTTTTTRPPTTTTTLPPTTTTTLPPTTTTTLPPTTTTTTVTPTSTTTSTTTSTSTTSSTTSTTVADGDG